MVSTFTISVSFFSLHNRKVALLGAAAQIPSSIHLSGDKIIDFSSARPLIAIIIRRLCRGYLFTHRADTCLCAACARESNYTRACFPLVKFWLCTFSMATARRRFVYPAGLLHPEHTIARLLHRIIACVREKQHHRNAEWKKTMRSDTHRRRAQRKKCGGDEKVCRNAPLLINHWPVELINFCYAVDCLVGGKTMRRAHTCSAADLNG